MGAGQLRDHGNLHTLEAIFVVVLLIGAIVFVLPQDRPTSETTAERRQLGQTARDTLAILDELPAGSTFYGRTLLSELAAKALRGDQTLQDGLWATDLEHRLRRLLPAGADYRAVLTDGTYRFLLASQGSEPTGEADSASHLVGLCHYTNYVRTDYEVGNNLIPQGVYGLPLDCSYLAPIRGEPIRVRLSDSVQDGQGTRFDTYYYTSQNAGDGVGTQPAVSMNITVENDRFPQPFQGGGINISRQAFANNPASPDLPRTEAIPFHISLTESQGIPVPPGTLLRLQIPRHWQSVAKVDEFFEPGWRDWDLQGDANTGWMITAYRNQSIVGEARLVFEAAVPTAEAVAADGLGFSVFTATLEGPNAYTKADFVIELPYATQGSSRDLFAMVPNPMGKNALSEWGAVFQNVGDEFTVRRVVWESENGKPLFAGVAGVSPADKLLPEGANASLPWRSAYALAVPTPQSPRDRLYIAGGLVTGDSPYLKVAYLNLTDNKIYNYSSGLQPADHRLDAAGVHWPAHGSRGELLLLGGVNSGGVPLDSAIRYNLTTGTYQTVAGLFHEDNVPGLSGLAGAAVASTRGLAFVGASDRYVRAIDAAGATVWAYLTGNTIRSSPTFDDGVVYVGSDDGYLYALDASTDRSDGELLWNYFAGASARIRAQPLVHGDLVLVGDTMGTLHAVDRATGVAKWTFSTRAGTDSEIWSQPVVRNDVVYVAASNGRVFALDLRTGALLAFRALVFNSQGVNLPSAVTTNEVGVRSGLVVHEDRLYAITSKGRVVALAHDATAGLTIDWSRELPSPPPASTASVSLAVGHDRLYAQYTLAYGASSGNTVLAALNLSPNLLPAERLLWDLLFPYVASPLSVSPEGVWFTGYALGVTRLVGVDPTNTVHHAWPVGSSLSFTRPALTPHAAHLVDGAQLLQVRYHDYERPGQAVALDVGSLHACALMETGNVSCWGLADGRTEGYEGGDAVGVSARGENSCALLQSGAVACWGPDMAAVYGGTDVQRVGTAGGYACALLTGGHVECWGSNDYGHLDGYHGAVPAVDMQLAVQKACALLQDGNVSCWGASGAARHYEGTDAVLVRTGPEDNACALLNSFLDLYCWDISGDGDSHVGFTEPIADVAVGLGYVCVRTVAKNLECRGALEFLHDGEEVEAIDSGGTYVCARLAQGSVSCWGDGDYGQVDGYGGRTALAVETGPSFACVLLPTGSVECWGDNSFRQVSAAPWGGSVVSSFAGTTLGSVPTVLPRAAYLFGGLTNAIPRPAPVGTVLEVALRGNDLAVTRTLSLDQNLSGMTAVSLPHGGTYVFGGWSNTTHYSDRIYRFDPHAFTLDLLPARLPVPLANATGAYDSASRQILLFGGDSPDGARSGVISFQPLVEKAANLTLTAPSPRTGAMSAHYRAANGEASTLWTGGSAARDAYAGDASVLRFSPSGYRLLSESRIEWVGEVKVEDLRSHEWRFQALANEHATELGQVPRRLSLLYDNGYGHSLSRLAAPALSFDLILPEELASLGNGFRAYGGNLLPQGTFGINSTFTETSERSSGATNYTIAAAQMGATLRTLRQGLAEAHIAVARREVPLGESLRIDVDASSLLAGLTARGAVGISEALNVYAPSDPTRPVAVLQSTEERSPTAAVRDVAVAGPNGDVIVTTNDGYVSLLDGNTGNRSWNRLLPDGIPVDLAAGTISTAAQSVLRFPLHPGTYEYAFVLSSDGSVLMYRVIDGSGPHVFPAPPLSEGGALAVADYNADGFVDHVIAAGLASQEGNVTVHQMDGGGCHGSFPRERIVSVSAGRLGVYATAANAPEAENGFVVATEKTLAGFTATCHKLWEASFNLTARYPDTIVRAEIVDLDGDGIGEVVVQVDGPEETRDRVVVYDGTTPLEMFHFKEQGFESGWVSIAVADSMTAYVGTRSTLLKLSGSDFSEVTELGVNWLTGGRVRMVRDVEVLDNGRVVAVGQSSNCSAQSCPSSGSDVRGIVAIYDPATGYYGEMIAPDSRNYVAADSRDNRVVAVAGSRVLVSDDGGTTWLNRTIADPQGWYSYSFTDVAYVANDRILAAGTHTNVHTLFSSTTGAVIAASSDGGATWQNVTVPINNKTETIRALAATTNGLVLGLVTNVTGARIIRSTDNGFTWQNVTTGWKTDTYSLPRWLSLEGERGWAIAYGIAYQTTNGGLTWLPYLACTVNVTACPLELRPARDDNSYKLFGVAQWGNLSYILQSNGNDGQATSFSRPTTGASGPANRVHFVGGFAANATAVGVAAAEGSFTGWIREAWLNVTPRVTEGLDPCNCLTYHLSNDGGKTWRKVTPNFKTNFATGLPFQSKCPQGCALLWRIEFGRNSQWNELPRIGVLPSVKVDYITDAGNGSVRGTYMEDFSTMDAMAPGTNADWGSTGVGLSLPQAPAPRWQRWYTSALAFDARLNFTAEPSPDVVIAYERSIANEIATDPNPWIRINPGTGDLIHNPSPQGLTPRSPSSRAVQTKTHVAFGLNGTLHKEIPLGASMIQATPRTGLSGYEDRAVVYANPLSSKLSAYSAASATQYCCSPQPLSDIQWVTAFALRDYDPLVNRSVDLVVGAYDGSVTVVWANNSTIRWQSQLTEPSGRYTHMYDTTLHPFYGTYLAEAVIRWRQTTDDNGVPLPTEIEMAGRLIEYFDVVKQVLTENGPVTFKPRPQLYQLELLVWYPTSPHRLART